MISRIPSPPMVFLVSFHAQIRVDEPLFHAAANYWVPTQHVFHFNGVELCPTFEEFGAIMGRDLPSLLQVVFGVPLAMANRWCIFGKLNLSLVFAHFSSSAFLVGERPRSYFLCAFCLCALARYFLVQRSYCVDLRICMVVYKSKRGNLVGLILVETFNGLDAFRRKEASFFARSPLLF